MVRVTETFFQQQLAEGGLPFKNMLRKELREIFLPDGENEVKV